MMNNTRWFDRRGLVRAALTLILALCLCLSVLPTMPVSASEQSDALGKLVSWGVMRGDPDGGLHPERAITRAEFVALMNRAYGYKKTGNTPFVDVPYTAWYSDDVSIAYNARYFDGTSSTTAEPEANLTREQAMTLLARGMRLDSIAGEVTEFSDGRSFSTWSRGYVKAAYQKRLIGGYGDGTFKPLRNITRGEMAILLSRALGALIHEEGKHTLGSVYGNVTINTPGVTLSDTTIVGDLYITGGLELGSVLLDNVRVLGSIIVAGGGESEAGQDSVVLRNVRADELKIDSLARQYLSLRAEGDTIVTQTLMRTDAYLQDRTEAGKGLLNITLQGSDSNAHFTLAGNLENVVNKSPGSTLKIARGTLGNLTIDEAAVGSNVIIESDATVKRANLDTAVNVTGGGSVGELNVNTEGSSTSMLPDDINIRPGITSNVYGETMDTELGNEASSDPRILAGYPKASDVGPTTMSATIATNKSGTLYWAVSSITDGSVGEQGLLSPASYGSKAVKYGTLQVGKSNTELTVSVTGLTIGGSYYFSAMLVDARNDRSPVKVVSFGTPDNTVPAFASGYPTLITNWYYTEEEFKEEYPGQKYDPTTKYYGEFYVKSTKSCNLYWAVFTKGSSAPTAAEFRSQSLSGSIAKGTAKAERNADVPVLATGLKELTDYDIYFWLCDYDGTKSSAVKKVTFKTVDGTPPEFNQTPIPNGQPKANSISLTTNVNEAGTVYWVAVPAGKEYPSPRPNTISMDDHDYYILQIVSGMNGIKNGKVSVKANTDAAINISGLEKETSYDIWYIAMDTAGNYSVFYTREEADAANKADPTLNAVANFVTVSTLDTTAPTVTQEFSNYDTSTDRPYPDTDISLIFSEDVLRTSEIGKADDFSLWTLALMGDEGKEKLTAFLKDTITLNYYTPDNKPAVIDKDETGDDAVLNYETATVTRANDGKGVIVTFKNAKLDSGTYYWFVISGIADTSIANNAMSPVDYPMSPFITVSSKVILSSGAKTSYGNLTSIEPDEILSEGTAGDLPPIEGTAGDLPPIEGSVDIDIAFTMTPEATSREDSSREWDMLIWANTSVTFEIYRRELPDGVPDDTPWERLPHVGKINLDTAQTNAGTFLGLTLFKDFDYETKNGTAVVKNHSITELDDNGTIYQYGIHIITLEDNPTRSSWSKNVTFQFNIVTGTNLRNDLTGYTINEANYNKAIGSGTVDDITEALRQDLPFRLTKPFEDTKAPEFSDKFPVVERSDTALEFTVSTDRSATLYWLVAPIGSTIPANDAYLAFQPTKDRNGTNVTFVDGRDNLSDTELDEAIKTAVESGLLRYAPKKTELSEPASASVYRPSATTDERIKIGSASVNTIPSTVTIEDLAPSTGYFVYFVLKGIGPNSYSDYVMLYKVATTPPDRPVITLSYDSVTTVSVRTADKDDHDMDTHVNYMIIRYTDDALTDPNIIDTTNGLSLSSTLKDCFEKYGIPITNESLPSEYRNYTLLKALTTDKKDPDNYNYPIGSIFDLYAPQDVKNALASFIAGTVSSVKPYIAGNSSMDIPLVTGSGKNTKEEYNVPVNCDEYLSPGSDYIFLSTAVNTQGSDTAFRAYEPVAKSDGDAPAVTLIAPTLTVTRAGNQYNLNGILTLIYDKDLYQRDSNRKLWTVDTAPANASRPDNFKSIESLDHTLAPGISFITDGTAGISTETLQLRLTSVSSGATSVLDSKIANASGTVNNDKPRTISITFKKSSQSTADLEMVDVTITSTDWKGTVTTIPSVLTLPVDEPGTVTSISLNKTSLTLYPGDEDMLTATYSPASATPTPTLYWTSSDPSVAKVEDTTGRSPKIEALKPGTATITVTTENGHTATCRVTVSPWDITLNKNSLILYTNDTPKEETLKAEPTPTPSSKFTSANPDKPKFSWTSSDTNVATVDTDGKVKAENPGTATITVTDKDGYCNSATCTVTVIGPELLITPGSVSIKRGDTTTLNLTITGISDDVMETIKDKIDWQSTDLRVITFSPSSGTTLTGVGAAAVAGSGSASIYAQIKIGGKTYTSNYCQVTLTP